jgi:hypothetical protein
VIVPASSGIDDRSELEFENVVTGTVRRTRLLGTHALTRDPSAVPWSLARAPTTDAGALVLGPGDITVAADVRPERGRGLVVRPGTTLRMARGVSIVVVHGRVSMEGTADAPIAIEPAVAGERWGGLLVMGPDAKDTVLRHVTIRGGTIAKEGFVNVTGMASFHRTDGLVLEDVDVSDNDVGDDVVHVIHSNDVTLRRVHVHDGRMDCIDFDYVRGRVEGTRSERCGNDGLDFMTSTVELRDTVLANCSDKGASVGEASHVQFASTRFEHDHIGIQAKDLSRVLVGSDAQFEAKGLDLSAYKKSAYYGRGGCLVVAGDAALTSSLKDESMLVPLAGAPTDGWEARCWPKR